MSWVSKFTVPNGVMANGTIIVIIHLQLTYTNAYNKHVLRPHGAKKEKNFRFRIWASDKLSLSKITYKYNSMLTYIPVLFYFLLILGLNYIDIGHKPFRPHWRPYRPQAKSISATGRYRPQTFGKSAVIVMCITRMLYTAFTSRIS